MLERFQGPNGRRVLLQAIERQPLVCYRREIAERIVEIATLQQWNPGDRIIEQGSSDRNLFLILVGLVSIRVKGRERATRGAGKYVGEMALLDPHLRPAASVFAVDITVTARISEPDFSALADAYPCAWRSLAAELASALRLGNQEARARNSHPVLFIGSSTESLPIVQALEEAFRADPFAVQSWTAGVFDPSNFHIEALEAQLERSDFAVVVMGRDDVVQSRGTVSPAPQDNVVFELGLFMGVLGRKRTFVLLEHGDEIKLPSDLLGLVRVTFPAGPPASLAERIAPACEAIRQRVHHLGPR